MSSVQENNEKGKKRKKKRSQIQMAKKFARKRNHGTDVDADTYQYMVRIMELMKHDFPTFEEKLIFVNNVYEQSIGHEIEYARNQLASRVLDSLLKYANLDAIQRLVDAFNDSLRPLSSDRFASHVLQNIVLICADRGNEKEPEKSSTEESKDGKIEVSKDDLKAYNDIVLKLSRYFINNIEEFVWDTYANHLLRTVIECLGGLIDTSDTENKKKPVVKERRAVIQEYKDLLIQSCNRFHKWPQFLEFGYDELTSGLLQSVLYSLKDIDSELMEVYIQKITEQCFKPGENDQLPNIFHAECSVRLLEACLAVTSPESFHQIYEKFFKGNMKKLAVTQATNFSVQRLLDHCPSKEDLEQIFEELSPHFSEILQSKFTGVLSSVGNACLRLQTKQGAFVNDITKMLNCDSTEKQSQMVACISTLKTRKQLEETSNEKNTNPSLNLHGSLILQAILNFNKPIKIVNSLLDTTGEDLTRLFSDPKGSRIVDAFMDSKYIGEKSRERLAKNLRGCWAELAGSTHGSRCLDRIWKWAQGNQRFSIMDELAAVGESLRGTKSGQIMSSKLNVPVYARSKKDWTESQGKEDKTRALFANIIGGTGEEKNDKKKKKKKKD